MRLDSVLLRVGCIGAIAVCLRLVYARADELRSKLQGKALPDEPTTNEKADEDTSAKSSATNKLAEDPMERIVSKIRAGLKKEGWAKQNLIRDRCVDPTWPMQ